MIHHVLSQIDTILGSGILNETRVSHHYPTVCFYDLCIENKNIDNETTLPHYDYCESNINEFNSKLVQKLSVESFSHDKTGFCKFTQCIQNTIDECFLVEPEIFLFLLLLILAVAGSSLKCIHSITSNVSVELFFVSSVL